MAGNNNAIGTGAIILTANADQALQGFNRVEKAAGQFAANTDKKLKSGTGGLLGAIIGGAGKAGGALGSLLGGSLGSAIGGPLGGLLGGALGQFAHPTGTLSGLGAKADELRPRATNIEDLKGLDAISFAVARVDKVLDELTMKFMSALAPAIIDASDLILAKLDEWGPTLGKIAEGFGAVIDIAVQMAGLIVDGIGSVVEEIGNWMNEVVYLGDTHHSVTTKMVATLKPVAIAVGYVWDTLKAGAGIFLMIEGLWQRMVGNILKGLADLAKQIPNELRPTWADSLIEAADKFGDASIKSGHKFQDWGTNAIMSFGNTAAMLGNIFDNLDQHIQDKQKQIAQMGNYLPTKLGGAFQEGSKEAFSINAQYQSQGRDLANMQQQQIDAIKNGNKLLQDIRDKLAPPDTQQILPF